MDAFKITCVTCNARLAVRDHSLVGQILACPRCGSMVQVTAPIAAAGVPVVATTAPAHASPRSLSTIDVGPSLEANDLAAALGESPTASIGTEAPAAPPATGSASTATASKSAPYKLAAVVLAGAVAGSALVVAGLSLLRDDAPPAPTVATAPAPAASVAEPAAPNDGDAAKDAEAADATPATPPEAAIVAPATPPASDPKSAPPVDPPPAAAPVAASDPLTPPAPPHPPGEKPSEAPPVIASAPPEAKPEPPAPRLRIDPLEVDAEGMDLSTLMHGAAADPVAALNKLDEPPAAPVESRATADPEPGVDAAPPAAAAGPVVRREEGAAEAPANVPALLARRVPAVKVQAMPLCRFVDFAGQLAGVPVSVDPEQLRLASASPGAAVSVDLKDATIEDILAAALKPLRLAPAVDNSQLVLRRSEVGKRRTTVCPVDDLAGDAKAVEQLAGWVQQLVAPESWKPAGGDGVLKVDGQTLQLDQREDVTYETFILLERYRLARGLPTRTKYPAALLVGGATSLAVGDRLAAPVTFTFSDYTPLREIFRYWQEEVEVAVLVDWPALAEDRLWPQTRLVASAIDKPWAEALDAVLGPLGLGWRPAGARAIQITTLAKIRTEPQLELYRLAPGAAPTVDELQKQIDQFASADAEAAAAKGATAVAYDAANHVLLVRQSAAVQRRLGTWLREKQLVEAK